VIRVLKAKLMGTAIALVAASAAVLASGRT
jgi:hypothetical protein